MRSLLSSYPEDLFLSTTLLYDKYDDVAALHSIPLFDSYDICVYDRFGYADLVTTATMPNAWNDLP